ncbi:MAG: hypothetical protein WCO86_15725, partial [Planctomycetota bacterium]
RQELFARTKRFEGERFKSGKAGLITLSVKSEIPATDFKILVTDSIYSTDFSSNPQQENGNVEISADNR